LQEESTSLSSLASTHTHSTSERSPRPPSAHHRGQTTLLFDERALVHSPVSDDNRKNLTHKSDARATQAADDLSPTLFGANFSVAPGAKLSVALGAPNCSVALGSSSYNSGHSGASASVLTNPGLCHFSTRVEGGVVGVVGQELVHLNPNPLAVSSQRHGSSVSSLSAAGGVTASGENSGEMVSHCVESALGLSRSRSVPVSGMKTAQRGIESERRKRIRRLQQDLLRIQKELQDLDDLEYDVTEV
jgi:hypothetical protein